MRERGCWDRGEVVGHLEQRLVLGGVEVRSVFGVAQSDHLVVARVVGGDLDRGEGDGGEGLAEIRFELALGVSGAGDGGDVGGVDVEHPHGERDRPDEDEEAGQHDAVDLDLDELDDGEVQNDRDEEEPAEDEREDGERRDADEGQAEEGLALGVIAEVVAADFIDGKRVGEAAGCEDGGAVGHLPDARARGEQGGGGTRGRAVADRFERGAEIRTESRQEFSLFRLVDARSDTGLPDAGLGGDVDVGADDVDEAVGVGDDGCRSGDDDAAEGAADGADVAGHPGIAVHACDADADENGETGEEKAEGVGAILDPLDVVGFSGVVLGFGIFLPSFLFELFGVEGSF